MYSVFESWMVTEYYAQHLEKSSMSLSAMFGIMTTLNSIVAIISGVLGESLVAATGTKVSPIHGCHCMLGIGVLVDDPELGMSSTFLDCPQCTLRRNC